MLENADIYRNWLEGIYTRSPDLCADMPKAEPHKRKLIFDPDIIPAATDEVLTRTIEILHTQFDTWENRAASNALQACLEEARKRGLRC